MNKLRRLIDGVTMYRVMLYSLVFLVVIALTLSALGVLTYSSFGTLLTTLLVLLTVTGVANIGLARLYGVTPNHESGLITSLILFFVLSSPNETIQWIGIAFAAIVAIASKYVVTWRSAHIFNPAAFGVVVVGLMGIGAGAWWIATSVMFVPMLLVALIVLYKVRRFEMFLAFLIPAVAFIVLRTATDSSIADAAITALTLYPLLFLGSIMLTEPSTMPASRYERAVFGAVVGFILVSSYDFGFIAASPELALVIGNAFAFAVTKRSSAKLKLVEKTQLTPTTYAFKFKPNIPMPREAGQYMEFTLPTAKLDTRGNRRSFTIASAPSDEHIEIGIKFYEPNSAFKQALANLKLGDEVIGNHVAGEFLLPTDKTAKLVFIAGGIGITPFISMIRDMLHANTTRPVELYYFVADETEVAYKGVLKQASEAGVKVHIKVGREARLTDDDIAQNSGAHFYLSGPPGLVDAYKQQLNNANAQHVHVDYFTGY